MGCNEWQKGTSASHSPVAAFRLIPHTTRTSISIHSYILAPHTVDLRNVPVRVSALPTIPPVQSVSVVPVYIPINGRSGPDPVSWYCTST
jgi:hypothetical protein